MKNGEHQPNLENVSSEDALYYMQAKIADWSYKSHNELSNAQFLTRVGHWALETFGQANHDGEWFIFPHGSLGEGFDHSELPPDLQQIVMSEQYGEVFVGNDNSIKLSSKPFVLEVDAEIPYWEDISKLSTFTEKLRAIRTNPSIMAGLKRSQFLILPGIQVDFRPPSHYRWGLQYIAQSNRIDVVPYGDYGRTEIAFQYAADKQNDKIGVALTLSDLIFLGIKYGQIRREIAVDQLDLLDKRIAGEESIPLEGLQLELRPGNYMKSLLIAEAIKQGPEVT